MLRGRNRTFGRGTSRTAHLSTDTRSRPARFRPYRCIGLLPRQIRGARRHTHRPRQPYRPTTQGHLHRRDVTLPYTARDSYRYFRKRQPNARLFRSSYRNHCIGRIYPIRNRDTCYALHPRRVRNLRQSSPNGQGRNEYQETSVLPYTTQTEAETEESNTPVVSANLRYLPDTMESASNPIRKPPSDTDCRKKPNRKNVRNIEKNIRETAGSPDDDTRPEEFLRPFCHIRLPPFPDTEAGRTSPRPLGRMLRHSPNRDASKLSSSSKSGASNSERPPSMNRR